MTKPPKELYYASVFFENNFVRTPNIFVKPTAQEVFVWANRLTVKEGLKYLKIRARKMSYVDSFEITQDFYHSVSEDQQIEWNGDFNQAMVEAGESSIPNVLVSILVGKVPGVAGKSYFLDEWYHTTDVLQAKEEMKQSNLPLVIPATHAHLYLPTTEIEWCGWN